MMPQSPKDFSDRIRSRHPHRNGSLLASAVLVVLAAVATTACGGRGSISEKKKFSQTETGSGSGSGSGNGSGDGNGNGGNGNGGGSATGNSTGAVTEPVTVYDAKCEEHPVDYFGLSRRYHVRLYPPGICPADQNEKTPISCLRAYGLVLEREFFLKSGCKGARTAALVEFFTFPEVVGSAAADGSSAIDAKSGPVFLRIENEDLQKLFNSAQFCGMVWPKNYNLDVTGKTCGENDPFLAEKTPVFSRWKRSDPRIQFGGFAIEESERPTTLDPELIFNLR